MDAALQLTGDKTAVFDVIGEQLQELGIGVTSIDQQRPWGGFFVIDEADTDRFIQTFFPEYPLEQIRQFGNRLSPKILVVAPGMRLSWQYHFRRAELWRGITGPVGYVRSKDDTETPVVTLQNRETVQFDPQERHRLIGLENWGVVAEFWQHTDPEAPSDESDIVRVQDDFGR